jgi:hypothetical protein
MKPLPPRVLRQRIDRAIYICRFWGPVWSWRCIYSEDRRRGCTRRRALRCYIEDGFFGALWRLVRHGR